MGWFPCFHGTMRSSDSLPSIPPCFVSFARRFYLKRLSFAPSRGQAQASRPGSWSSGLPSGLLSVEMAGPPRFLGGPHRAYAVRKYPGRSFAPRPGGASVLPPIYFATRAPATVFLSGSFQHGLSSRCLRFAARLPFRVVRHHARLACRLVASLCRAGLTPCGVPYERFPSPST